MPDQKYSGLPSVAAALTTHEWGINESGTSKKINVGQILALLSQGTLAGGYAQVVANQGTFTALTDLTNLTVTVTVGTGRRIRVSALFALSSSVAADIGQGYIREGATSLQIVNVYLASANVGYYLTPSVILTPTTGAHTYKLSAQRQAGTGNITMRAAVAT